MGQKDMIQVDRAELTEMVKSATKREVENSLKPVNDKLDKIINCLSGNDEFGEKGIVKRVQCLEEKNEYFDARDITRKNLIDDYTRNGKNWNTAGEYARNVKAFLAFLGVVSIGSVIAIIKFIKEDVSRK